MLDYTDMPIEHIVVDGSNIATEARSLPSLKQLEEAVAELRRAHPNAEITVIVDATFAHRIDPSELPRFEQAVLRGEYVHPPAGAIGRGDAFLLRVAEKVDGTVLSNDSFQEFHGEHPWLFERGRLLGGTPVPGIGWIFSPRQPVRGPRSRQAVRETVQAKKRVTKAIAVATKEVVEPAGRSSAAGSAGGRSRSGKSDRGPESARPPADGSRDGGKPTPLAVNDPLAFISFIAEHPLGEQVEGEVEGYTSHGAVVRVGEMRCYVPLANLGDPAPRSARRSPEAPRTWTLRADRAGPATTRGRARIAGNRVRVRSSQRGDRGGGGPPRPAAAQACRWIGLPGRGAGEEVVGSAAAGEEGRTEEGVGAGESGGAGEGVGEGGACASEGGAEEGAGAGETGGAEEGVNCVGNGESDGGGGGRQGVAGNEGCGAAVIGEEGEEVGTEEGVNGEGAGRDQAGSREEGDGHASGSALAGGGAAASECARAGRGRAASSKVPSNDGERESWTTVGRRSRSSGHELTPAGSGSGRPGRISEWR